MKSALEAGCAAQALTLVLTTSAVPTNPDTVYVEAVLASYVRLEPALRTCRKILVCDAAVAHASNNYRVGKITEAAREHYAEYVDRLEAHCAAAAAAADPTNPFFCAEVLRLPRRHGFGPAVKHALALVTTPYVMVIQHDRRLVRPVGVADILLQLQNFRLRHVNYVCLGTRATWNNGHRCINDFRLDIRDGVVDMPNSEEWMLSPLGFWYDSTHICRTNFYRQFAMQGHAVELNDPTIWRWKTGEFIEDKLGQILRRQVKLYGYKALLRFGTFLLTHKGDRSLLFAIGECGQHDPEWYLDRFFEAAEKYDPGDVLFPKLGGPQSHASPISKATGCIVPQEIKDRHVVVQHANQRKLDTLQRQHAKAEESVLALAAALAEAQQAAERAKQAESSAAAAEVLAEAAEARATEAATLAAAREARLTQAKDLAMAAELEAAGTLAEAIFAESLASALLAETQRCEKESAHAEAAALSLEAAADDLEAKARAAEARYLELEQRASALEASAAAAQLDASAAEAIADAAEAGAKRAEANAAAGGSAAG